MNQNFYDEFDPTYDANRKIISDVEHSLGSVGCTKFLYIHKRNQINKESSAMISTVRPTETQHEIYFSYVQQINPFRWQSRTSTDLITNHLLSKHLSFLNIDFIICGEAENILRNNQLRSYQFTFYLYSRKFDNHKHLRISLKPLIAAYHSYCICIFAFTKHTVIRCDKIISERISIHICLSASFELGNHKGTRIKSEEERMNT